MALWDKVKDGLDKANRVAQEAFDEGKTRLDSHRARQAADKAAESLGYAVFRAWESGGELEPDVRARLTAALREREAEARRLEAAAREAADWRAAHPNAPNPNPPSADAPSADAPSADAPNPTPTNPSATGPGAPHPGTPGNMSSAAADGAPYGGPPPARP